MSQLIAVTWSGLIIGSEYAVLGVSFVICYRALKVVNLAVGSTFVMAGLFAATMQQNGIPVSATLVITGVVCALLLPLQEVGMLRFLRGTSPSYQMLSTLAFATILQGLSVAIFGRDPLSGGEFIPGGSKPVGILHADRDSVAFVACVALMALLAGLYLTRTKVGRASCAAADDPDAARMLGINVTPLRVTALLATGLLIGLSAVPFMAGATVDFTQGLPISLLGFVAAAMFGFESVLGALVGGWIFGIAAALATAYVSSVFGEAIPFSALVVMLLVGRRLNLFPKALTA
jgi:branched-subunit amino acid ABC-type transport system permease component